ncbi:hypothetical protein [Nocardioides sp. AE5]|uniref:hypothetical protein n=1 Tax=Nocardioides sp. AE5 TaxID=2962573 RepID=UPI002881B038|nr:hypothetical protein [Nocardioides sp. AE5]MDT0202926.1 hypothetical protein [Nocardioides sp. AE5]
MSGYSKSLPHRALRRARRSPRVQKAAGKVLTKIRSSDNAREVVNRIFAGSRHRHSGPPRRYPPAGNLLAGTGLDHLPVAMVSLLATPAEQVDEVIDEIARLQVLTAAFRPIFVMTHPRLDAPRRYGWATELLISPEEWERSGWDETEEPWEEYAAARIAQAIDLHDPALMVHVPAEGIDAAQRLLFRGLSPDLRKDPAE